MSNRQFSLTIKAIEIIESIPKRTRSKFVSDAVVNYAKKKDIFDEYIVQKTKPIIKTETAKNESSLSENKGANKEPVKQKINIDKDF